MVERALIIRAEGNAHTVEFDPQSDFFQDIARADDIIGILFLDRMLTYPEKDRERSGLAELMRWR